MPRIAVDVVVPSAPDLVWQTLRDVRTVAACMPGAELTDELEDDVYKGLLRTKLGAIKATFKGQAKIVMEDATKTGSIDARGVDANGGSQASAKVSYAAEEAPDGTRLMIDAEIKVQGRLAQFGRTGLLQEIGNQMIDVFAENLAQRIAADHPNEVADH